MEKYIIPKKFKKAEAKWLQKDRNYMYKDINKKIDKDIGRILEQIYLYDSENYVVGIHRTGLPYDQIENDIFENGIKYGESYPYLHDHVQIFKNYIFFLRELLYSESYKNSIGALIVKVPKRAIDKNLENPLPLFYKGDDEQIYLKPEYICAYIPVRNRQLGNVKFNNKKHIYNENTEYYYDEIFTDLRKQKL